MKTFFTSRFKWRLLIVILLGFFSNLGFGQLGTYQFTGVLGSCPNNNNNVSSQPANATFSSFSNVGSSCIASSYDFYNSNWNTGNTIDLNEYNQFTITPNAGYGLTLTTLSFSQVASKTQSTFWILRSSIDNFSTDIATGSITTSVQAPVITLPSASFTNVGAVTFRLYVINSKDGPAAWSNDNVSLNGSVYPVPSDPGNPTSNSPQCSNPGVTLIKNGVPPAGVTWYWQTSPNGTNTINSASTYTVGASGIYYLRAQDNTTLAWSTGTGSLAIIITPDVGTPVFSLGASSSRCQGATTTSYQATATDNNSIIYTLDASSVSAGNTIDASTGAVNYVAGWTGTSTITAIASGCGTSKSSNHTVTTNLPVTNPVFALGSTSTRCQGLTAQSVTYSATANNSTGITYILDATADAFPGNSINSSTGAVIFSANWSGTSTVTASAAGCYGPLASTHTITTTPTVGIPVFTTGTTSSRCQAAGVITYAATSTNNTGIIYSLDNTSLASGNTINSSTGDVIYTSAWYGTSVITATATGCNGPKSASHTVTINAPVTTPVFTLGSSSLRCQAAGSVTYTASSNNTTGITYALDAASISAGNTIVSGTGRVTFTSAWTGISSVTATAAGCYGPQAATHTITTELPVAAPIFATGLSPTRCQGAGIVNYSATSNNTTGITYALNASSISAGNTVDVNTGDVTYVATYSGTTTITATAAGNCTPKSTNYTVTVTPTVGTPVFSLGSTSARCQASGAVTYAATATNNTGLTYSLDAASVTGGNSINSATGVVTYVTGWSGTSVITATASGCNGPSTASHTVTITPQVSAPVFALGTSSTRCQGLSSQTIIYTSTAANSTSITYALDATTNAFPGNSINTSTGAVTYSAGWAGTSTITATAINCPPNKTSTHVITTTPTVGSPVFASGATSSRCQGGSTVNYSASATNTTGITYTLDNTSSTAGNTINSATGDVTYIPAWFGTSVITATAAGCNGPKSSSHTETTNQPVTTPVFTLGATSIRCQGSGSVTYTATASYNTGISYSLDATTAVFAGNSFNTTTGALTYSASWTGTSAVTATATGCYGPLTSTHTITITPSVGTPVFAAGPSSTRCQGTGTINYQANATNTSGITYSLNSASVTAGNTIDVNTGDVTYVSTYSGTTIITANASGSCSPKSASHTVNVTPTVGTPVFSLGSTSARCQASGVVTYAATATNNTGITYSLDAASISGGNSINSATGIVTYVTGWSGTSVITATASGCNGPSTASHTVTITPQVSAPVFALGTSSTRCQGLSSQTIIYTSTAANSTSITYALDATTNAFPGNSINTSTGAVTYSAGWAGTSTITATAINCPPNKTSTHVITTTPTVGSPVFASGATSSRCQGGSTVNYSASATNTTGITYTLDNTSSTAGNTINSATGDVTYIPAWFGTSVITATAAGCNGPKSSSHTETTNQPVTTPVFTLGATSIRCQGSGSVTYTATASYTTGISYSLDATTAAFAGNSFNTTTGTITYAAGWTGTSTITVTVTGCYGPNTATHTVTTTPYVTTPVFAAGGSSTRCQGLNTVNYQATSSNTSGITYTLDATSLSAGNTINSITGAVTYNTNWNGSTTITASAAGCNGPKTAIHTVTITATVGKPVFASASSTRTQAAGSINYGATATTTTGITYSLDATSLSAGNTINSLTGTVTYVATWSGGAVITASAAGCNGPVISTHIAETNPTTVTTPLYLSSNPSLSLTRISPIAINKTTTVSTSNFKSGSGVTFTQSPPLCNFLTIKNNSLKVITYVTVSGGTLPVTPNISAKLRYDSITIINLINPVFNSGTGIITWTGTPASDVIIPAGKAISIDITSNEAAAIKINYDSKTSPSRIELPVSNYVNITSFKIYDAPYPAGDERNSSVPGVVNYIRTVASSPFGASDVTGVNITITPNGNTFISNVVDSSSCSKTFEYNWNTPAVPGKYSITASALQGYENTVSYFDVISSNVCTTCPPVAINDSASGAGGAPILIDVLDNDYDPNNNINKASLTLISAPKNGDAIITGYKFVYVPNGTFAGRDTFRYQMCDSTGLCAAADVYVSIDPTIVDPCSDATKSQVYYIPYPEQDARAALMASASTGLAIDSLRDIISLKMPYPNMTIVWDHWEDGYETDILNPTQSTTQVWGDGNPYNGIAPGYADDILPAGANIVLDNTMLANPRGASNIFYDGKDKVFASGQVSIVQVVGEPSIIGLQCMKTNVTSTQDFGKSFTVPVGQNFPSKDFAYTALFIRAAQNNTVISIDKDNNGTYETVDTLSEGQSSLVSGVLTGANITSSAPIGVDLHFGGIDSYSSREVPIYPASWYSSTYYSPVPTTGAATTIKDTNAVYLYNNLTRAITINWSSGIPSSGSIVLPAKSVKRFPLALSQTAAYKFVNPTGESFTALQVCDSYTPGGGGNSGSTYDWSFNLISEERLTAFATLAWAPGSTDGTRNDNPIWVTPSANTTIYVKYNGDLTTGGSVSPCGLHYDISYPLNALNHKRLKDLTDNDQGGLAVYTCDGTKIAAVYGEDPSSASTANPSWDVGSTMRPFCGLKLIFANDDYAFTVTDNPVTIPILKNDYGFTAVVDPTSVITTGMLQPKNGSVTINSNGTLLYSPNPGYQGKDTFEYRVCSTPSPIVCDNATVYVTINSCPPPASRNILYGKIFLDRTGNGVNSSAYTGFNSGKVYLYTDGNCNGVIDPFELSDSVIVDTSGHYQFITYPEKIVSDNFDATGNGSTCGSGSDGNTGWAGNWVDAGDPSTGFCVTPAVSISNTHAEIIKDGSFGYGLRLKYKNVSASRSVNLNNATYAFLTFSYRRKSSTQIAGHDIYVQASSNGSSFNTIFTIKGDGTTDASYVTVYNQDITSYASSTTIIRFLTNNIMGYADSVYIDNVSIKYLKYPQCYIVKVPQSSLPWNYYMTTPSQTSITFAGSGSCTTPNDFGVTSASLLPITLLNFTGQAIKQANLLNWSTSQEINSSHFEIETKTDATDFIKIGRVEAKGNSVIQNSYSFVHQYPPLGANYYRLKIFDKDNKFKYSNIIVLKADGTGVIKNSIYPNPFKDKIEAAIVLEQNQMLNINIYDVNGKAIKSMQTPGIKGLNLIKISDLGNITLGIYFLEIKTNEINIKTKLFKIN